MSAGASGPLSLDRTPYMREILKAARDPEVEEITLCFAAQASKTLCLQIIVLYYLFEDPWPCLHVMPRESDAKAICVERYQPIIDASPSLKARMSTSKRDQKADMIRVDGNTLNFAWSNSPASVAFRSAAILAVDETDKYELFSGREADPVSLARERTLTFSGRKILKTSTPTTEASYIWKEYQEGDRREFYIPCPHCASYQKLIFGVKDRGLPGVKWPEDVRDPERIIDENLAWYECEHCQGKIVDHHLPEMLKEGVWAPAALEVRADGSLVGTPPSRRRLSFKLPRLYSPWHNAGFSYVAAEFCKSVKFPPKYMNFRNSWLAEIYEEHVEELKDAHLRSRKADYDYGEIPPDVHLMAAGVDVQLDHLWYVLRGFGSFGKSWLIKCGRLETFEELHRVLIDAQYFTSEELRRPIPISMIMIDVGYAERKDEVIGFSQLYRCQPVKGAANLTSYIKRGDIHDSSNRPHRLITIQSDHFKARLHRDIRDEPPMWLLPRDVPEEYLHQLCVEQRVLVINRKTGHDSYVWKKPYSSAANHMFDCECYVQAAADLLEVRRILEDPRRGKGGVAAIEKEKPKKPARRRQYLRAPKLFSRG